MYASLVVKSTQMFPAVLIRITVRTERYCKRTTRVVEKKPEGWNRQRRPSRRDALASDRGGMQEPKNPLTLGDYHISFSPWKPSGKTGSPHAGTQKKGEDQGQNGRAPHVETRAMSPSAPGSQGWSGRRLWGHSTRHRIIAGTVPESPRSLVSWGISCQMIQM